MSILKKFISFISFIFLLILNTKAYASGYMFEANSTEAISTSINNLIETTNPSIIANNPAGITYLQGTQISLSLIMVLPKLSYKNAKGSYFLKNENIEGESSNKNISQTSYAPSIFISHQLNPKYYIGLGIYPSMAASTDYSMNSILRYNINKTFLMSININPVIAFKLNDSNSISVGIISQYTKAKLREFADFNTGINNKIPIIGKFIVKHGIKIIPRKTDLYNNMEGSEATAFGFNMGWIWDIKNNLRIGLAYISRIKHSVNGSSSWNFYGEAFDWPVLGNFLRSGVRENGYVEKETSKVKCISPDSFNVSLLYKATNKINLMTQATWTHHDLFNGLKINFENIKTVPNGKTGYVDDKKDFYLLKANWKNTWKFGLGITYQLNDKLQLRSGIIFDKSPIRSDYNRFSTIPDNDRLSLGIGTNYLINKNQNISLGYLYVKFKKSHGEFRGWCGFLETGINSQNCVSSRTKVSADFSAQAHLFGIQYNLKF